MDAIDTQLALAEFEEAWVAVRYHEGQASVADVQQAIRRVNKLRRLADQVTRTSGCPTFGGPGSTSRRATSH